MNSPVQTSSTDSQCIDNMEGIDKSLLAGLDALMTQEEQLYITNLMTSGDTMKLAQAAQILYEVKRVNIEENTNQPGSEKKVKDPILKLKQSRSFRKIKNLLAKSPSKTEQLALEMANDVQPLAQMPKYVVLKADFDINARHNKTLQFKDDGWDGTMADAFSRMYAPEESSSSSEESISSDDDSIKEEDIAQRIKAKKVQKSSNSKKKKDNRVIVAVSRQALRCGIEEGDVVTHVNMEEFDGDANDLHEMINDFYIKGNKEAVFNMVLNAEQSVARELQNRHMN
ncbi:hypothetical protein CTEN210_01347 [Chaetoceros tenuissimus]|uniref:Uncharacterized protein n=1 Tax=Chaetoceros tenuissimus TaxID=426638 RepID=A0AAD3CFF7_9STRA|nr:hypothetical protein CTEN210_01347 [Chaetoceros tenuissimus]